MTEQDKVIEVKGIQYRIVSFLDEYAEETTNEAEACTLLLQKPEDRRPSGVPQAYKAIRIEKGSLCKMRLS